MDFVAIDFETANPKYTSACSLALVTVKNNVIVDTKHWYIKPQPNVYYPLNTELHGIDDNITRNSPTFDKIWLEVLPLIENNIVIAHNAAFDINVIRHTLDFYHVDYDDFPYLCTYKLAQLANTNRVCYKLNILAETYNIQLQHHNAISDASACCKLFIELCRELKVHNFEELKEKYDVRFGRASRYFYRTFRIPALLKKPKCKRNVKISEINNLETLHEDEDFHHNSFVFTGALKSMPRSVAWKIIVSGGGRVLSNVSKSTNYLVCGIQDIKRLKDGTSSKMKKAVELNQQGYNIQIIDEVDFLNMIDQELIDLILK